MNNSIEVLRGLVAKWRNHVKWLHAYCKDLEEREIPELSVHNRTVAERLDKCADELDAALAALAALSAQAEAQAGGEVVPNESKVICPSCCHQFRAIPVQVQQLMLDAGFEPPFTTPPPSAVPEGMVMVSRKEIETLRDCSDSVMRDGDLAREMAIKWLTDTTRVALYGWKLVPVEPTEEMLMAGASAWRKSLTQREWWDAMLDAIPEPKE